MSLSRAQWEEMWENANRLETISNELVKMGFKMRSNQINEEVINIKRLIQSVIGQME